MAHRDFSASVDEAIANRPTFTLRGVDFMCKPAVSMKAMAPVLDAINAAEGGVDMEDALKLFFDTVLIKAARPKMHELLEAEDEDDDDDAVPLSLAQLIEIMQWLIEQYTGIPTQASTDSTEPQDATGETSKANGSSPEGAAA